MKEKCYRLFLYSIIITTVHLLMNTGFYGYAAEDFRSSAQLFSMERDAKVVDAGDKIAITVKGTNDISKICIVHYAPSYATTKNFKAIELSSHDEGLWQGSYEIYAYDEAGVWTFKNMVLYDWAGNRTMINRNELSQWIRGMDEETLDFMVRDTMKTDPLAADLNEDGIVNIEDLSQLSLSYGSKSTDKDFDRINDLNYNGSVDLYDLDFMATQFDHDVQKQALMAFCPGYIAYSEDLEASINPLDTVAFAWGRLEDEHGIELNTTKGENGNYDFYFPSREDDGMSLLQYCKDSGKSTAFSVFADRATVEAILPDDEKRQEVIEVIIDQVSEEIEMDDGEPFTFDGIVVDFEGMKDHNASGDYYFFNHKVMSEYFDLFLFELKDRLHAMNKKLYVTVPPRKWMNGYNYDNIIKNADQVILMAHDYASRGKISKRDVIKFLDDNIKDSINSLAPIHRVEEALIDIASCTENQWERDKIALQISFGTAQWQFKLSSPKAWESLSDETESDNGALSTTYETIAARLRNEDGKAEALKAGYNNEVESPYITYYNTDSQTYNFILYEDSRSISAKINKAKAYGLNGISIWCLGKITDFPITLCVR